MKLPVDWKNDPTLQNLKGIAERGGEHGPFCDKGVLDTVAILERGEKYVRSKLVGLFMLLNLQRETGARMLTD